MKKLITITNVKRYVAAGIASAGIVVALSAPALAATVFTNGSFETGADPSTFTTLNAVDNTSVNSWTVTSGSVDYIGTYWTASNGARSFDLSGNDAGAISQTFSTVAGHNYTVTFDLAGNPAGPPTVKTLNVDAGAAPTLYSFDTSTVSGGVSLTNMGWMPESYTFTATSSNTALTFTSTTSGAFGPALDNVTLTLNNPTAKNQCKNGGWKEYTNPSFKNQDQCVDWVQASACGNLRMSQPSQKIVFDVSNNTTKHDNECKDGDHDHDKSKNKANNKVEYWNFDQPDGNTFLHYKADVTCAFVNPQTNEARFMFQIPAGHPGLSGLYVVSYVKEVKNAPDLYGHNATPDLATATQWCQTGTGFAPAMYPVTKGHVEVE